MTSFVGRVRSRSGKAAGEALLSLEEQEEVRIYRMLIWVAVGLVPAYQLLYHFLVPEAFDPFWMRVSLSYVGVALIAASYLSAFVQRHIFSFMVVYSGLLTTWFLWLTAVNSFAGPYASALLMLIPSAGLGLSMGLKRVNELAVFFVAAIAATYFLANKVGGTDVPAPFLIANLACSALVILIIAYARLQAQQKLRAEEERYRAVVEESTDGICIVDGQTLRFLEANAAFLSITGYSPERIRTMTPADLCPDAKPEMTVALAAAVEGRAVRLAQQRMKRAGEEDFFAEIHINPIHASSRRILSIILRDVSHRIEHERSLVQAKDEAERVARFKATLLENMSHEFRTPLSGILGWTAVLREEAATSRPGNDANSDREILGYIEASAQRLHETLDSLLELADLTANRTHVHSQRLDVSQVLEEIMRPLRARASRKNVEVRVSVAPGAGDIFLDARCFRRVVAALGDNAIKFTDSGHVSVDVERQQADLVLRVSDTGIGIEPTSLSHLFQDFTKGPHVSYRAGTGIGLALTHRLVDLLNGTISVRSELGVGTELEVRFRDVEIFAPPADVGAPDLQGAAS